MEHTYCCGTWNDEWARTASVESYRQGSPRNFPQHAIEHCGRTRIQTRVGPSPMGIRVLVGYGDVHYQKGGSTGKILTAYPIDLINYANPQLGKAIYKKGGNK